MAKRVKNVTEYEKYKARDDRIAMGWLGRDLGDGLRERGIKGG